MKAMTKVEREIVVDGGIYAVGHSDTEIRSDVEHILKKARYDIPEFETIIDDEHKIDVLTGWIMRRWG